MTLALAVAAVIGVAVLSLIWLGQRRLIYFPDPSPPSLERAGLAGAEAVTYPTSDGLRLAAWFIAGSGSSPRPTVVVFSGNAGHRGYRVPLARALRSVGLNVLLTDYRGYGGNPGTPTEEGLVSDAQAARAYVLGRPDVDPVRVVYFGESLGAAVALRLAIEHPPSALVLRSPFASLTSIGQHHYPLLPVRLLLRDRFASIDRAPRIRCPVLVIAGTSDGIIPIGHTRRLYDAITAPKTFVEIDADHNDESLLDGEPMIQAIVRFVNKP
ncbi:MAG TPA: alpha/beta hydrolase [Vicinamibacterales bacterium]|nr:alpha/beta hydrolase [Vicinamibacterales bacterium]